MANAAPIIAIIALASLAVAVLYATFRRPLAKQSVTSPGATAEQRKAALKERAEASIQRLKNVMSELRGMFDDQSKVDLSNIEQHLANAERQFAAGSYGEVLRICFGPLIALEDSLSDIKLNHRQGKIESFAISVSNPGDDGSK